MTVEDVRRLARRGEGPTLEFKHRVPEPERLAKEMIAFANTDGGRVLIGVNDNGEILGVKDSEEEEFAVRTALDAHCKPTMKWRARRVEITRKRDVIVLSVPRSLVRPHYLISSNGTGKTMTPYVRFEDHSIEASPEAIELMKGKANHEDVHFEFGAHELALMKYLEEYARIDVPSFSRLINEAHGKARDILVLLTRAGILSHHLDYSGDYFMLAPNKSN